MFGLPIVTFPVDYQEIDGVYEWVIEFQCEQKFDHVWCVGINWYSRRNKVSEEYYQMLLTAAEKRGLGFYMERGEGVYRVDQTNCTYAHV